MKYEKGYEEPESRLENSYRGRPPGKANNKLVRTLFGDVGSLGEALRCSIGDRVVDFKSTLSKKLGHYKIPYIHCWKEIN